MKKFLAVLSLFFLLPMLVFTSETVNFSYVFNYEKDVKYYIYFTNDTIEVNDKFEFTPESTELGFYMHILTNGGSLKNIELSFGSFVDVNGDCRNIPFGVSVSRVQKYYTVTIYDSTGAKIDDGAISSNDVFMEEIVYTGDFTITDNDNDPSSENHYIYNIEYFLPDNINALASPQTYTSTITVTVNGAE